MGFRLAHQKDGLNRPGLYRTGSRGAGFGYWRTETKIDHAKWRRIAGITVAVEEVLTAKERRAGLKQLATWIEERMVHRRDAENAENGNGSNHEDTKTQRTEGHEKNGMEWCDEIREYDECKALSVTKEWVRGVEDWAGVRGAGRSLESLCAELGLSRVKLSALTKEYCGLSAQELVDGFRVRELRKSLAARVREAAQRLWGNPGSFAAAKIEGMFVPKRSRYFRLTEEAFWEEERGDEMARRTAELADCVRRELEVESFAVRAGFGNAARLRRACVNVLGRTLASLEKVLAAEVVRYYVCAEDKALRQVACRAENNARVARARWAYSKSEEAPTAPFLDAWSAAEELDGAWLAGMKDAFG